MTLNKKKQSSKKIQNKTSVVKHKLTCLWSQGSATPVPQPSLQNQQKASIETGNYRNKKTNLDPTVKLNK